MKQDVKEYVAPISGTSKKRTIKLSDICPKMSLTRIFPVTSIIFCPIILLYPRSWRFECHGRFRSGLHYFWGSFCRMGWIQISLKALKKLMSCVFDHWESIHWLLESSQTKKNVGEYFLIQLWIYHLLYNASLSKLISTGLGIIWRIRLENGSEVTKWRFRDAGCVGRSRASGIDCISVLILNHYLMSFTTYLLQV